MIESAAAAKIMQRDLYPLCFAPVYRDYLWGGTRIAQRYGRVNVPAVCAESWEISDRADGMSVILNGPLAGSTLGDLMRERRGELLGPADFAGPFPLLIKILDARQPLSIQVHPNNAAALQFGGEPKTEMWYVLDAEPGSLLYAGLRPGVTPAELRAAIAEQTLAQYVQCDKVSAGDSILIPGGRVHALGAGSLILEVQQNSNTTYRLYDWARTGPDGRLRALHVEEALRVIDWQAEAAIKSVPTALPAMGPNQRRELARCAYFVVEQWEIMAPLYINETGRDCSILFVISGAVQVDGGGQSVSMAAGTTCLIPAACRSAKLSPQRGPASLAHVRPLLLR